MAENVIEVTDESFAAEVLQAQLPVLVDFWAPWCGPCRQLSPTIERFAGEVKGKLKVAKHNTQDSPEIAVRYRVTAIPTLILFKAGEESHRVIGGGHTVDRLKALCREHLGIDL
ncbi:MAG: thioredoxin [Planctomycetes bacterium]|nr:thioredoxin [Planctomycetota bacterium]